MKCAQHPAHWYKLVATKGQVLLVKAVSNAWTFLYHQEVLFA